MFDNFKTHMHKKTTFQSLLRQLLQSVHTKHRRRRRSIFNGNSFVRCGEEKGADANGIGGDCIPFVKGLWTIAAFKFQISSPTVDFQQEKSMIVLCEFELFCPPFPSRFLC